MHRVQVEVPIDEAGNPKVEAIRFRGVVPASSQEAIIGWLMRGSFEPARKNGAPVPGIYIMYVNL